MGKAILCKWLSLGPRAPVVWVNWVYRAHRIGQVKPMARRRRTIMDKLLGRKWAETLFWLWSPGDGMMMSQLCLWQTQILRLDWPGGHWTVIKAPVPGRQQKVSLWGVQPLWFCSGWSFLLTPSASDPVKDVPFKKPSWGSNTCGTVPLDFQKGEKYTSVFEATQFITFFYENWIHKHIKRGHREALALDRMYWSTLPEVHREGMETCLSNQILW